MKLWVLVWDGRDDRRFIDVVRTRPRRPVLDAMLRRMGCNISDDKEISRGFDERTKEGFVGTPQGILQYFRREVL